MVYRRLNLIDHGIVSVQEHSPYKRPLEITLGVEDGIGRPEGHPLGEPLPTGFDCLGCFDDRYGKAIREVRVLPEDPFHGDQFC